MAGAINQTIPLFSSVARTVAAYTSDAQTNLSARGARIFISATIAGGGTLDLKVQRFNPASQTWVDWTGASIVQLAATGVAVLTIYPGLTAVANVDFPHPLGVSWRIVATVGTATTTFRVDADYLI